VAEKTAQPVPSEQAQKIERQEKLPASDEVTEVAPGVLRIQLPIFLPGLGHVNCYALEDEHGVALIDPGLPGPESYEALTNGLAQMDATPDDVHTVFVTHSHPDHFGGAGRLRIANGSEIVAHEHFRTLFDPRDDDSVELLDNAAPVTDPGGYDPGKFAEYLLSDEEIPDLPARKSPWGGTIPFPGKEEIQTMRTWDELTKRGFVTPQPSRRLVDNETINLGRREWFALHTPGHTGDHLCLFEPEEGILLSGDHVLPTITPHISGMTPSDDALADFFAGLDRVAVLDGVSTVLPAHGHPFADVAGRAQAIKDHHAERLDQLEKIAEELGESDVISFSHQLFQERSWGAMAESETYAHLEHLRIAGRAHCRHDAGRLFYSLDA
jgi:glyoxylase-like metal-dependent hydrolase (beta-lactamase superfamily II)